MRRKLFGQKTGLVCFAALVAVAPEFVPNEYFITVLIIGALHTILTVGLNLLMGYAGQISLGHAAFYGIAAYTSAILTTTYRWPVLAGIAAAITVVIAVAYVIGKPMLKLKGHYLAMGTLGFGFIVFIIFNESSALTGGPSGLSGIPKLAVGNWVVTSDRQFYYVVWATALLLLLLSQNFISSRFGRALQAIHTSEFAASVLGIDVARHKLFVFLLSAGYAAVAGVLFVHYVSFVSPTSFGPMSAVLLVSMVVLGGMASLWGSVAGAIFLTILPEVLRAVENFDILIYGGILVLCMMFLPGGLAEGFRNLSAFLRRCVGAHPVVENRGILAKTGGSGEQSP